jgi:hypothetical protein
LNSVIDCFYLLLYFVHVTLLVSQG